MSAMVTQLSYSINEKLCLDEPTFPAITQQQLHKTEATTVATNKTTTSKSLKFNQKEIGQWSPSVSNGSPPYEASATSSNTEKYMQRNGPSVFGFSLPRHKPQQRSIVFTNRSIKPVALVKAQLNHDNEETTMYDLQENNQKPSRNSFSAVNRFEKWPSPKSTHSTFAVEIPDSTKQNKLINSDQQPDMFPSIVIKSCKLHSPIKSTVTQIFADNPPNKRHCRSVSEPEEMLDRHSPSTSPVVSSWNPNQSSRVWRTPIRKLGPVTRRVYSSKNSRSLGDCSRTFGDCSWSLDAPSLHSEGSVSQDTLLTPPSSPVPRPASVTVINRGNAYTVFSSQHSLSEHSSFSPLSSPCENIVSPISSSSTQGVTSSILSATKRSLSFSEDFEYRASIQYTPTSTPDLDRRFDSFHGSRKGGLLRCQSHPADLNVKKTKGKRRLTSRLSHRPTLDFAKMKQTCISRRKSRENSTAPIVQDVVDNSEVSFVQPIFPATLPRNSIPGKISSLKPVVSRYSPPIMFSIGCTKVGRSNVPSDCQGPVSEDDLTAEQEDVAMETIAVTSFERDCTDLNVDAIENEDSS